MLPKQDNYKVGIYLRLSKDDERQGESLSIENQRRVLTNYVNEQGWSIYDEYVDDGISGVSFDRPGVQRMLDDAKAGRINLIICKDMSRFGRNYIQVGQYVDYLFPMYNIRFIALTDNIDTLNSDSASMDMLPIMNVFNEWYAANTSKKLRAVFESNARSGKYKCTYCAFGYFKSDDGFNTPIIDPYAAAIVRRIFEMRAKGFNPKKIADILNAEHIPTPSDYQYQRIGKPNPHNTSHLWGNINVQRILKKEKYVGDALLQKSITVDCITHKVVKNNGERPMYLVTDHHTPIVDRDTFNRVQQELARRTSKRKINDKTKTEQGKYSGKYALSELLICGHCGTPYRRRVWSRNGKKQVVWRCISRLEHGKKYCPDSPTIKEENLHQGIIKAINNYYSCRNDIARILKANIGTVLECQGQEEIIAAENRLKEIDRARNELVGLIATGGCDEDKLDSEFEKLYEEEQSLSERLVLLKSKKQTSAETQAKLDKIIDMIEHEKFELETFDNVLIRKLIECVKVLNKAEILVIFKGVYEVRKEIE